MKNVQQINQNLWSPGPHCDEIKKIISLKDGLENIKIIHEEC